MNDKDHVTSKQQCLYCGDPTSAGTVHLCDPRVLRERIDRLHPALKRIASGERVTELRGRADALEATLNIHECRALGDMLLEGLPPAEPVAPTIKRHPRDCGCTSCHYSQKFPQVKPHHENCGCFECVPFEIVPPEPSGDAHDEKCGNCGAPWSKHLTNRLICPDAAIADVYRFRQVLPVRQLGPNAAVDSIAEASGDRQAGPEKAATRTLTERERDGLNRAADKCQAVLDQGLLVPCVWRDGCRNPATCAAKGHCDAPTNLRQEKASGEPFAHTAHLATCQGGSGGRCCDPDCETCWPDSPENGSRDAKI